MFLISCLFHLTVVTAQAGGPTERVLVPHFVVGQELTYRGTIAEEATGQGVQFNRNYRLEVRVFVLGTPPSGAELAFLTLLRLNDNRGERVTEAEPSSVRLELVHADLQGRISAPPGVSVAVPLDGLPTMESGCLVEFPRGGLAPGKAWQVVEPGRPPLTWQVLGSEAVNGMSCLKLAGLQQSPDWELPRGDRPAWQRRETVWLSPRLGVAYRIERTIERRDPGHVEPTQRSSTKYELESPLQYPGKLYEDRRREILLASSLAEGVAPYLSEPGKYGSQPFDKVLARIKDHMDVQPPTPYRDALLQLKRRVEAARRGESPPAALLEAASPAAAAVGHPAPDFTVPDYFSRQSMGLHMWQGRPVVLFFYSPTSQTADELLRFAQRLGDLHRREIAVVGLVVGDDDVRVRQQRDDLGLTFPLLAGKGLRLLYEITATPKIVLIDAQGIVRATYVGWGREMPGAITTELRRWLGRSAAAGTSGRAGP
jgi:peroxiredoxin